MLVLTQCEDTKSDDDLFTGSDASDQSVQNTVIPDKRHHSLSKPGVAGDVHRSAAIKHGQRFTENGRQRSEVTEKAKKQATLG